MDSGKNHPTTQPPNHLTRRTVYALLITLTAGITAGRILSAQLVFEPAIHRPADRPDLPGRPWPPTPPRGMPTYGSNDRARWCAIRALVDHGTYAIGHRDELPPYDGLGSEAVHALWLGRHLADATALMTVGIPGPVPFAPPPYRDRGITFEDGWMGIDKVLHPVTKEFHSSKPPLMPTVVAGGYWVLKHLTGWTLRDQPFQVIRTLILVFNLGPLILYLVLLSRLVEELGTTDWGRVFVMAAGCLGTYLTTFSVTLNNHVPAAVAVIFALYPVVKGDEPPGSSRRSGRRLALAGLFGAWVVCNELPAAPFGVALFLLLFARDPRRTLAYFVPAALVPIGGFLLTNYLAIGQIRPAYETFGSIWYNFPGGYWAHPIGIDAGGDAPWLYAFHLLLGHHGIFSLTPVFLLAAAGMVRPLTRPVAGYWQRWLPLLALGLTLWLLGFYLKQTQSYNFGGWTSGPRWFFWLTPLWLLAMVPAADALGRWRWGRGLGYVLLALSALSVSYPAWNPWRHPWLYNLMFMPT
jgi:hypothetical protein